ncbi:hypothetical protein [Erwinia phyllosphaerae]|uniref:hypothetical protein n=1 Tax=Erwinia phyllosphaerae TaxID=2853256 RepID=UPI001FED5EA2|nr:hypothetical protein [Erwinia phyllosphaerae]MBV4368230.1 hypothetical protein [Erwinia phyllosphaerae]
MAKLINQYVEIYFWGRLCASKPDISCVISFMKFIKLILALALIINSACAMAGVIFRKPESVFDHTAIIGKAEKVGLSNVTIDTRQTFDIIVNGQKMGSLVQGKGWVGDVHRICFINWSTEQNPTAFFMQTIGADDWELVDCDKVESVGTISNPGDKEVKIAIFYRIYARVRYTEDYVVLGLKNNNEIYYDKKTTERFQNVDFKNIAAMRKEYQSTNHNN